MLETDASRDLSVCNYCGVFDVILCVSSSHSHMHCWNVRSVYDVGDCQLDRHCYRTEDKKWTFGKYAAVGMRKKKLGSHHGDVDDETSSPW